MNHLTGKTTPELQHLRAGTVMWRPKRHPHDYLLRGQRGVWRPNVVRADSGGAEALRHCAYDVLTSFGS
jgi:hypothetical protein